MREEEEEEKSGKFPKTILMILNTFNQLKTGLNFGISYTISFLFDDFDEILLKFLKNFKQTTYLLFSSRYFSSSDTFIRQQQKINHFKPLPWKFFYFLSSS